MKLVERCPECNKPLEILFESSDLEFYKCGHSGSKAQRLEAGKKFQSLDGELSAYDYQIEGYEFCRNSNFNCLIGDGMGLGKTMQSLLTLKNHPDEMLPCLIIQKSATTANWAHEISMWLDNSPLACFPMVGKQIAIFPGFKTYVISMDSLTKNLSALKELHKIQPFKSVIVDECHSFKEDDSKRTQALIDFLSQRKDDNKLKYDEGLVEGKVEIEFKPIKHRIFLSGTPIKNRADEFFVTLNLLRPRVFSSRAKFRREFLTQNDKGAWTNINKYRKDYFDETLSEFVIRRDKTKVLKDLPPFSRHYDFVTIESEAIRHLYNKEVDLMSNMMAQKKMDSLSLLGWLAKMRHITGMAKIQKGYEFAKEYFENTELEKSFDPEYPEKLAIGIHHKGVREELMKMFKKHDELYQHEKFNALSLSGEDSAYDKSRISDKFNFNKDHKILVANELAGGVGLNLQGCANVLSLERQWNSADEEQFEARFWRHGQKYPVTCTYIIVDRSIDLFFHEMVEEKRKIFQGTFNITDDPESIRTLVHRVLDNRL